MLNLFRKISPIAFVMLSVQAFAQPPAPAPAPAAPVADSTTSDRQDVTNEQKDHHYLGHVELKQTDTTIYADDAWFYSDTNRFVATGNVVFAQGNNRIAAERAEFDTQTRLGTFYNAWGIATAKPPSQAPRPGAGIAPPPMPGQETIVYFFGETIEKIGPRKYKITKGGFSTCVQPTPRWDLHAGTVILNVDHYTVLKNAVLAVKGVPMLYLPIMYYPTKREDRATGFLIPAIGTSTLRGESIHDAFFWAINRSQDATILHDWFSKTGQGLGGEYRYNFGSGIDGNIMSHFLDQHEATYTQSDGAAGTTPVTVSASRSYEIRGSANQLLPGNLRMRANVNYFSSIVSSQTFNTNIYDLSRNQRSFGANVIGGWGSYSMNATFDHSEYFYDTTDSNLLGSWPRVQFARNERPILNSPAYFSITTEYAQMLRVSRTAAAEVDTGLSRMDVSPQIRYPFKKWQWFTVNSTLGWRDTYYTRSYEPTGDPNVTPSKVIDVPLNRPLFTFQSQIVGPVFNRVWDTPDNGYAEKFKHSIEPFVTVLRTSAVDNFAEIVQLDGTDNFVGGTNYTYGVNNRFYAKRRLTPGLPAQSREIFDVEVTQTYYTDQRSAAYDRQYQTTIFGTTQSNFSPISLNVRAMPSSDLNVSVRAEFDSRYLALRTISAQGSYSWTGRVQIAGGWSKRGYIPEVTGFNDRTFLDHTINGSSTVHTKDNRVGGAFTFSYDVLHSTMVQQRVSAFYNSQCCGIAFEYLTNNYLGSSVSPIAANHQFFLSFTLAGLGNFSPFNGALAGVPR
jgi:LPS-assembly protein